MSNTLRVSVLPEFRKLGFKGTFPHLRRITKSEVHLITFQFDKYGGGFVIEISKTKNEPYKTYWGEIIEVTKLTTHYLNDRIRIHPKGLLKNSNTNDWFRYDKSIHIGSIYKNVAKQVIDQIELIEKLFYSDSNVFIEC
jgi:hypothetical protein